MNEYIILYDNDYYEFFGDDNEYSALLEAWHSYFSNSPKMTAIFEKMCMNHNIFSLEECIDFFNSRCNCKIESIFKIEKKMY